MAWNANVIVILRRPLDLPARFSGLYVFFSRWKRKGYGREAGKHLADRTWANVCDEKRREERAFPCGCRYVRRGRIIMLIAHGGSHPNVFNVLEMLPRKERIGIHLQFAINYIADHLPIRPFRRTPTGLEDS